MLEVRKAKINIPTYGIGEPDKNPMFLENRVYQASKGKVYPYPVVEKIQDEKQDKEYNVIFLENEYIKLMLMPELGGRIQYGFDKKNNYYFFYNNEVIKPALVGLCGPWISGGVEFNWPQHHRPSTFSEVEYMIEEKEDSITVWMGEIEKMSQMTGRVGVRLYRDKSLVEVLGKSTNSTEFPQNFLWWANIAVHVHEEYESFFPTDVTYVADHGKRDITAYPFANSIYYNIDYSAREKSERDITNYKNIPVPMSYMALGSKYNFFGGYDFKKNMGTIHVSNTHTAPGKKQWTWGNGEFGYAWDRHLTDENGPYIELMAGVYTDNQPDFTWIFPNETKEFKQIWYPFKELGKVKNASEDCAIKIDIGDYIDFGIYAVRKMSGFIELWNRDEKIYSEKINLSPGDIFQHKLLNNGYEELEIKIIEKGKNILGYKFETIQEREFYPYEEAELPQKVKSNDELYQIGVHLEQYRHATYNPEDYYLEALKRDEGDARCNQAMGFLLLKKGKYGEALKYFEKAKKTLTKYNPNPINCDVFYGIGLCYKYLDDFQKAYASFYKAIWDFKFKNTGYLELAKIDLKNANYEEALSHIEEALKYNAIDETSLFLKEYTLEKLGKKYDYSNVLAVNPLHHLSIIFSKGIIPGLEFVRYEYKTIIEMISFLYNIGDTENIKNILKSSTALRHPILKMIGNQLGLKLEYEDNFDYVFPHRNFELYILEKEKDSFAKNYLLGNYLYDKKEYRDAIENFEKAYELKEDYSVLNRNLGVAYYNIQKSPEKALEFYKKAYLSNPEDSKIVFELDALRKNMNHPVENRIEFLNQNLFALDRDDLYLEYVRLHNQKGEYREALQLISEKEFRPFEGGEGKVIEQYRLAHTQIARDYIKQKKYQEAQKHLMTAGLYPENIGEGKIHGTPEADLNYYLGIAHEEKNPEKAREYFLKSSNELTISSSNLSYKPEKLEMYYYQGKSLEKLGLKNEALKLYEKMIEIAKKKIEEKAKIDYFAISVPELIIFNQDYDKKNKTLCHYLIALGQLGLGNISECKVNLKESLKIDINNQEAKILMEEIV